MNRRVLGYGMAMIIALLAGLPVSASSAEESRVKAFVSILPQAYLVERIGGDYVEARVLVGEGQGPHTYEPTPAQMAALADSDIYFTIGVPFETVLLPRIQSLFPHMKIADTVEGVRLRYFSHGHEADPDGFTDNPAHSRQKPDPHTWLDPGRVKIMAGKIAHALKALDPGHAGLFDRNLQKLRQDLDRVDAQIAGILAPLKGRRIYVFHPAFGYFCEAYGLEQRAIERAGKEPGARELARIIESARNEGVKAIFIQPQFSDNVARAVAEAIGGEVVPLNSLPEDYLQGIKTIAEKIRETFPPEPCSQQGE